MRALAGNRCNRKRAADSLTSRRIIFGARGVRVRLGVVEEDATKSACSMIATTPMDSQRRLAAGAKSEHAFENVCVLIGTGSERVFEA
jgi:hypothetical protein